MGSPILFFTVLANVRASTGTELCKCRLLTTRLQYFLHSPRYTYVQFGHSQYVSSDQMPFCKWQNGNRDARQVFHFLIPLDSQSNILQEARWTSFSAPRRSCQEERHGCQ